MTREQLDEIEKLASDPKSAAFHDLMARQTIPLVKALREARAALDQVSSDDRMSEAQITAAITEAAKERDAARESLRVARWDVACLWEERDEARAEVERLSAVVQQVHALAATEEQDYRCVRVVENLREIHTLTKEEP